MNQSTKTGAPSPLMVTDEDLELINQHAIAPLRKEEVFVFHVVLCDNELDRDGERFADEALEKLAELFCGKTGIFDHDPKCKHQTARIYRTYVEEDHSRTVLGEEPYRCLKADAYMVRTPSNQDLIAEISGGIKKEVSIGFAAAKRICSICGANQMTSSCVHRKGESYVLPSGKTVVCYHEIDEPTDAYEWSFVAVPAQVNAGIIKQFDGKALESMLKTYSEQPEKGIVLTEDEIKQFEQYVRTNNALREAGDLYIESMKKEIRTYALWDKDSGFDAQTLDKLCEKMTLEELRTFHEGMKKSAQKHLPFLFQLKPQPEESPVVDDSFRI